jgi:hypothetical protein
LVVGMQVQLLATTTATTRQTSIIFNNVVPTLSLRENINLGQVK